MSLARNQNFQWNLSTKCCKWGYEIQEVILYLTENHYCYLGIQKVGGCRTLLSTPLPHYLKQTASVHSVQLSQARLLVDGYFQILFSLFSKLQRAQLDFMSPMPFLGTMFGPFLRVWKKWMQFEKNEFFRIASHVWT